MYLNHGMTYILYINLNNVNYLRIDINFFSVHEEINSKMWYTLEAGYARVCTTFLSLFRINEQQIQINPSKLIPN